MDCPCLAQDVYKIFNTYLYLGGENSTIPKQWPKKFSTKYDYENPAEVVFSNQSKFLTFISVSINVSFTDFSSDMYNLPYHNSSVLKSNFEKRQILLKGIIS